VRRADPASLRRRFVELAGIEPVTRDGRRSIGDLVAGTKFVEARPR
jgi:hypothetical protein